MQQDNLLINNSAVVIGKVVSELKFSHEVYGEGFYGFELEVPRLSDSVDILPVTVSERLISKENFKCGAYVKIAGQIRSYNNLSNTNRKTRLFLTVFTRNIDIVDELENKNPNEIYFNGFICKPTVYRTTPFGREICDILVAVNRSYSKSDYIPCISWGRNARFASNLSVGDNIEIWGRMQSRDYQKKFEDGTFEARRAYEISISKIDINKNTDNADIANIETKELQEELPDEPEDDIT